MLIATFCLVIKDLFTAVEEKNGGKLTPDQISRVSLKLGEVLGDPGSHEVIQNEKGQVRSILFLFLSYHPSISYIVSDVNSCRLRLLAPERRRPSDN